MQTVSENITQFKKMLKTAGITKSFTAWYLISEMLATLGVTNPKACDCGTDFPADAPQYLWVHNNHRLHNTLVWQAIMEHRESLLNIRAQVKLDTLPHGQEDRRLFPIHEAEVLVRNFLLMEPNPQWVMGTVQTTNMIIRAIYTDEQVYKTL